MIYQIFPKKDATIYEKKSDLNSGIDAILELNKILSATSNAVTGQQTDVAYSSRILMQFDYADLAELNNISSYVAATPKYILKLYATEEKELPSSFTLEVDTISGSWNMGLGRYDYLPHITEGVSWDYRFDSTEGTRWLTASYEPGSTGSWNVNPGGSTWYTGSDLIVTKSIDFNQTVDAEIDISSIVLAHTSGGFTNEGILVRRAAAEEYSITDSMNLQFFSSDTNTIYLPHIRVMWDDATYTTQSVSTIDSNDDNIVYIKNLKQLYQTTDKVKFRIIGRPKYPIKTFSTSSNYSDEYKLPYSSSYSIEDLHTKESVIPHDYNYTRISSDSSGSYFNFWMSALQPERWYKLTIRTKFDNNDVRIFNGDFGFTFKVERAS